ncbi:M56 family metallopeptidase, partial [Planctomycetota bacterium]
MVDLNQISTHLISWLSNSSIEAVVLVCFIILIHLTAGRRLPGRWRYAIWILLMIRLVMPWAPVSSVSVYNLLARDNGSSVSTRHVSTEPIVYSSYDKSLFSSDPIESGSVEADRPVEEPAQSGRSVTVQWPFVLMIIWLAGAIGVFTSSLRATIRLSALVRQKRLVTDSKVLNMLEDCKDQMMLRPVVGLVESDFIRGPAIFGWIRPRLILPAGLINTLSKKQLRHIFLHELAHIKRHDALWGWIMAVLQAIHWFNPFVWLAFYRMRSDREIACDQLVLDHIAESDVKSYGNTIVVLLQKFSKRQFLPALAGIAEHKTQIQRRISMISHYKKETHTVTFFAFMLLCFTAWITLTNAAPGNTNTSPVSGLTPA